MLQKLALWMLLLFPLIVTGQIRDTFTKIDKALYYAYEKRQLEKAIPIFEQIVEENSNPLDSNLILACYHLAIHSQVEKEVLKYLEPILNYPDVERPENIFHKDFSWQKSFYSFKSIAIEKMVDYHFREKELKKALYYLDLLSQKYFPLHSCGNGYLGSKMKVANRYASCYSALGELDSLISKTKGLLFREPFDHTDLADSSRLIVVKSLKEQYSRKEIKKEIERAPKSIKVENLHSANLKAEITFFGDKYPVCFMEIFLKADLDEWDEQKLILALQKEIENSFVFKKLKQ